ncbi:MAG: hypothetical protein Kow0075_15650 [Salibacteraceae bacterium]
MKVLFIGHNASYSGAPKSLLRIMKYLRRNRLAEFECLLRNDGPMQDEYREVCKVHHFLPEHLIPQNELFADLSRKIRLRRHRAQMLAELKNKNFDLIYSNTVVNANVLEFLAPLQLPVVSHQREMHTAIDSYGGKPMITTLDRFTNRYISVSNKAKSVLVEYGVSPDKIEVVYNFLEEDEMFSDSPEERSRIRASLGIPDNAVVVGNVGTINLRKGFDLFIETASRINRAHPEVHFVWVGGGADDEVLKPLEQLPSGIRQKVHLTGEIPHPYGYYQALDILLLTSRDDPFPLTAMEAAFYSKPVVCIDHTGGIPEALANERSLIADKPDADSIEKVLSPLIADGDLRSSLGRSTHKELYEELKIDKQMEKILRIISEVINRQRG